MSLPPKPKICPYCGTIVKELTRDHIVSRSLFVQPYPDNLPTVRVCYSCNQEKGLNEDYLRDYLILSREAGCKLRLSSGSVSLYVKSSKVIE